MIKRLKRPISFLSAFAMVMAMLLYFPSGMFSNIDWGLKASAAETITPSQPTEGDGSTETPYKIGTAEELYWFAGLVNGTLDDATQNKSANAVLTADITVNEGVLNPDGTLVADVSGFTSWTPIGNSYANLYTGTFDGQNHKISGLYFNDTNTEKVGLFGYVGNVKDENENVTSAGKVSNVGVVDSYFNGKMMVGGVCGQNYSGTITNCYNEGTVSGTGSGVGGVCGMNYGTITNCYNTGSVSSSSTYVGGVCGANYSTIENCYNTGEVSGTDCVGGVCGMNYGTITNCYNTGTVSGKNAVGGVCGMNSRGKITGCYNEGEVNGTGNTNFGGVCGENNGTITNCYNTGKVSGTNCVGGVCGANYSTIENCYNTGEVSGTDCVGGVCGRNYGTITNCYNTGKVSGTNLVGGVCGENRDTITNCYYLENCNAEGTTFTNAEGTSKNEDEFKSGEVAYLLSQGCTVGEGESAVTYDGSIWGQDLSTADSYPVLDSTKKVYQNETYASCEGNPGEPTYSYSNTEEDPVYADHTDGDEDGKCDTCSKYMDNIGARLVGHSLTLDGSVGVNFYMELSSEVRSDSSAYMEFTLPGGKTSTVKVSEAPTEVISGTTYYKFKCQVNATAMTDTITAQIKSTVGNSKVYEYTVKEYADYLFAHKDESTEFAEAAELIEAMVNYGSYAQIYAGYNTENLAVGDAKNLKSLDNVWISRYYEPSPYETKVQFAGANLSLLSTTTLRMYFKITNIDAESVLIGYQGQELEKTQSGDYYYVELVGIPASKLDDEFCIDVGDGSTNFVVTYTPMAYCTSVVHRETTETRTEDLKNLIKALVLYNRAADAYISEN